MNTTQLNPALTDLLRQVAARGSAPTDDAPRADAVSRVPGTRDACLAPTQMLALYAPGRRHPVGIDDRRLWCAEASVTVRKEGVEFNATMWFHPLLMTMVAASKSVVRAEFVVLYDAAARASATLREVFLYQKFATGDRQFIATLTAKDAATATLDIEQFEKAREQETAEVHARRAAAQDGYAGLLIGPEAVEEHRQREAERAASARRRKQKPSVATPISAAAQARARRQAEADEVYAVDPQPVAAPRSRRRPVDPLDGVRAADVSPQADREAAASVAPNASPAPAGDGTLDDDDVMPPRRSTRSRR